MKFDELRSIGHNIANSLAGGLGFLVGVYAMDVFGEARRSAEGFIEIDFLTGRTTGGQPSPALAEAISMYSGALATLCERHGARVSVFARLTARYVGKPGQEGVSVTVEDKTGRSATDHYAGNPLRRVRCLDAVGRVRRKHRADGRLGEPSR